MHNLVTVELGVITGFFILLRYIITSLLRVKPLYLRDLFLILLNISKRLLITLVPSLDLIIVTTSDSHSSCSKESVEKQFGVVLDLARSVIMSIDKYK